MKYNIIGDIHGRSCWKNVIREDCVNIFVGDYFSPYEKTIGFKTQQKVFNDIVSFKKKHPETVLLIGNHDEDHWHICERYSRHDYTNKETISQMFESNKDLFDAAYSIENKVLVTHAGVSILWYLIYTYKFFGSYIFDCNDDHESKTIEEAVQRYKDNNGFMVMYRDVPGRTFIWHNTYYVYDGEHYNPFYITPDDVSEFVNHQWKSGNYRAFSFRANAGINDYDGSDERQSPMWIRPDQVGSANIFKFTNYAQVVGHTIFDHPCTFKNYMCRHADTESLISDEEDKIFFVDCLQYNAESLIFDSESNLFYVNK